MPSATLFHQECVPSSSQTTTTKPIPVVPTAYIQHKPFPPQPEDCAETNAQIRADYSFDAPYFDLAGHVENRLYCMHNIVYADACNDETASLLDIGVKDLLPERIPPPTAAPTTATHGGVGIFAVRDIPRGGLILVERPLVVLPYIIGISTPEFYLYEALLQRLSPGALARFMALANCKPSSECEDIDGILRTNAMGIELRVPAVPHPELPTHRAVFLNTSRCNHACAPNAEWTWDCDTFTLSLEAVRPILAGEEITLAYIAPLNSCARRRDALRSGFNFTCRCDSCALPDAAAIDASDAAREELRTFWTRIPSFEAWCPDARLPDHLLIDAHKRALALIRQEGLHTLQYRRHLDAIAMGYGALMDVDNFRKWTRRARDYRPAKSEDAARVLQEWIADPASFPVWGWRRSLKGSGFENCVISGFAS
ncbi:hypothetical protein C8J57DRAFT_1501230 [Mycena rebaudengoi]|nr:hypothetical protein C8J57DRAFT_1501230 [Mycena rebaudengoi]